MAVKSVSLSKKINTQEGNYPIQKVNVAHSEGPPFCDVLQNGNPSASRLFVQDQGLQVEGTIEVALFGEWFRLCLFFVPIAAWNLGWVLRRFISRTLTMVSADTVEPDAFVEAKACREQGNFTRAIELLERTEQLLEGSEIVWA